MKKKNLELIDKVKKYLGETVEKIENTFGMVSLEIKSENLINACKVLKETKDLDFAQLSDLAGIDYSAYGNEEWETKKVTTSGFSRGRNINKENPNKNRFAVIYHMLSLSNNIRIRLKCYADKNDPPCIPSVNSIWNSANWFEREAFDLYGIFFVGHNDLRRILTDYGFIGHPFRKDFPLIGETEVRYDFKQKRIIYDPVSITERVLVPRVIRKDNRYK